MWQGGMHDREHAWQGGMCEGRAWQGVCVTGGMHGRGHAWQRACMADGTCVKGVHGRGCV